MLCVLSNNLYTLVRTALYATTLFFTPHFLCLHTRFLSLRLFIFGGRSHNNDSKTAPNSGTLVFHGALICLSLPVCPLAELGHWGTVVPFTSPALAAKRLFFLLRNTPNSFPQQGVTVAESSFAVRNKYKHQASILGAVCQSGEGKAENKVTHGPCGPHYQ